MWVSAVCKSLLQNSVVFWEDAWGSVGVEHPCCPCDLCYSRPPPPSWKLGDMGCFDLLPIVKWQKDCGLCYVRKDLWYKKWLVFTQLWVPWRSHGHPWWVKPQRVESHQAELWLLSVCYWVITKTVNTLFYPCLLVRFFFSPVVNRYWGLGWGMSFFL